MKYERALEQKVEEVLVNLLGPGKSRVMIRANVDFSSKESIELQKENIPEEPPFKWMNINRPAAAGELLPGVPDRLQGTQAAGTGNYRREIIFPPAMIKRLTVSLVLSEKIPEADALKVRRVVSELLALDVTRGDDILVMRANFAPIWYTSEMLGTLIKYGAIAAIAIIGMSIVSLGFLKMASAMRSMGGQESSQIRMEMNGGMGGEEDMLRLPETGEPPGAKEGGAGAGQPEDAADATVFNIKADKLEILVQMLASDEPADIAIIAVHLPGDLRSKFISMLPPQTASEVLASITKVRFVEPDLIAKIKEELERRLSGTVGGYGKAVEMIEKVDLKSKKALLEALQKSHPDVAAQVRGHILLLDDLEHFSDVDFAILAGAVSVDLWATASWRISESGRARLKDHLAERSWQILQQTMAYGTPPDAKIDAAAEQIISTAWEMIEKGRIKKPAAVTAAIGFNPAPAAPGA